MFGGGGCRFKPTCSEYTVLMIEKHGIIRGVFLGLKQLLRCNSWSR
ncbi:MAG: membrane protein insertion efficiency factor YidD [bacterium]|nr:MAG: membrane protein insertion efficiency factor YidD [bacterium]